MKQEINPKYFQTVISALIANKDARSAVKYISESLVVKATWHIKPKANNRGETMLVTFGKPNYRERKFVSACKAACDAFPIKEVKFKLYPKKRVKQ